MVPFFVFFVAWAFSPLCLGNAFVGFAVPPRLPVLDDFANRGVLSDVGVFESELTTAARAGAWAQLKNVLIRAHQVNLAAEQGGAAAGADTGGGVLARLSGAEDAPEEEVVSAELFGENHAQEQGAAPAPPLSPLSLAFVKNKLIGSLRHAVLAVQKEAEELGKVLVDPGHLARKNYYQGVVPAFLWAQNVSHIFITMKMSARWNAPGKTIRSFCGRFLMKIMFKFSV